MRSNPEVKVTKLDHEVSMDPNAGFTASGLLRTHLNQLLDRHAREARKFFLLEWEGDETPSGAIVDGKSVFVATSGIAVDANGKYIGTFTRLLENGGESGLEQKMIIAVK